MTKNELKNIVKSAIQESFISEYYDSNTDSSESQKKFTSLLLQGMIDLREHFSMFPLRVYDFISKDTFLQDELKERKAAREAILDILEETFGRANVKEIEGFDMRGLLTKVEIKNATVMIPVEFIYDPTQNQITSKFANPSNELSRILDEDNAKDALAASYFCALELKQLAQDIDNGEMINNRTFQKSENLIEKGIRDLYRTWEKALYKITKKFYKQI